MALIVQRLHDQVAIIEMNEADAETLHETVAELLTEGRRQVILDYRQVQFATSVEVAQVITARDSVAAQGGSLQVANLNSNVLNIFRILKLGRLFALDQSLDGALRALARE